MSEYSYTYFQKIVRFKLKIKEELTINSGIFTGICR